MNFIQFAADYGLIIENPISDGRIHRVSVVNGKPGSKDGAYCLYDDEIGVAGWVQNFKTGIYQKYSEFSKQSDALKISLNIKKKEQAENLQKLYDETAKKADYLINHIFTPIINHPYLKRKQIKPHGTYKDKTGALIVPLCNINGKIRTFQRIQEDGSKYYLKNGEMVGNFFQFGEIKDVVIICEGFSTGASICESTGIGTVSAMNAGNLVKVANSLRKKYGQSLKIIIAGDNDHKVEGNPGKRFAIEAAESCGGFCIIPDFTEEELANNLTDFNDLMISRGKITVKKQLLNFNFYHLKIRRIVWK